MLNCFDEGVGCHWIVLLLSTHSCPTFMHIIRIFLCLRRKDIREAEGHLRSSAGGTSVGRRGHQHRLIQLAKVRVYVSVHLFSSCIFKSPIVVDLCPNLTVRCALFYVIGRLLHWTAEQKTKTQMTDTPRHPDGLPQHLRRRLKAHLLSSDHQSNIHQQWRCI